MEELATVGNVDEHEEKAPAGDEDVASETAASADDSEDEDWTAESDESVPSADEELATADDSEAEDEEDISINLIDASLQQKVTDLIRSDQCDSKCLKGKARQLEFLFCSLSQMTKAEKTTSLLTLLGVLMQVPTTDRHRGQGVRDRFMYYLPFVGHVCRPVFSACYGVTPLTVQRYKTRVRDGNISAKAHGNQFNKHASAVDMTWLTKWFTEFAKEVGEVVPVRVRLQKKTDGRVMKYYSSDMFTLIPPMFTWDRLHAEMQSYVEEYRLFVREPAASTMRKLLSLHCPTIRIRSPRSNVCDTCNIYQSRMRADSSAERTEELGRHTESARRMRLEYKKDLALADSEHAVIVMDFSQNLTVPSVTSTPSNWYFLSLVAVNVFGIYYENEKEQTNYLYDEGVSGKGSDQINSMLNHFITEKVVATGKKRLTVYADNCSGQNKNNHVIKFFLAQVHMGKLERVDYKFFIKGHTKNACDRGFGHIRKHIGRVDCWTVKHVVDAVMEASTSSATVHWTRDSNRFSSYKPLVTELYKKLEGVQKFRIFGMDSKVPGVVECKRGPDSDPEMKDLRRKIDGILTTSLKVQKMFDEYLDPLSLPPLNAEKLAQMHDKVREYVPEEFKNDELYAKLTDQQIEDAKSTKNARRVHRASIAIAAKQNQAARGANFAAQGEGDKPPTKKRKQA